MIKDREGNVLILAASIWIDQRLSYAFTAAFGMVNSHFYASERAGDDSTRERKDKDRATGGIRSSVRRLQSPRRERLQPRRCRKAARNSSSRARWNRLSRSWRGMKADKEQQNDKRPANHRLAMQGTALFSQSRPGPAMQYSRRMKHKTSSPPQTNRSQFFNSSAPRRVPRSPRETSLRHASQMTTSARTDLAA